MGKGIEGDVTSISAQAAAQEQHQSRNSFPERRPVGRHRGRDAQTGTSALVQFSRSSRGVAVAIASGLLLSSSLLTGCTASSQAKTHTRPVDPALTQSDVEQGGATQGEQDPAIATHNDEAVENTVTPPEPTPQIAPKSTPETMALAATTADADLLTKVLPGDHRGRFRVGNQTEHPLRIAFLQQSDGPDASAPATTIPAAKASDAAPAAPVDLEPIHWDFAPGEGGQSGLLLSVPQGDVELRNGDVLVAFAQDGSRRYWGPYVVGQTQLPYWNAARSEWQLMIQP